MRRAGVVEEELRRRPVKRPILPPAAVGENGVGLAVHDVDAVAQVFVGRRVVCEGGAIAPRPVVGTEANPSSSLPPTGMIELAITRLLLNAARGVG
jgi:hypothetical protein